MIADPRAESLDVICSTQGREHRTQSADHGLDSAGGELPCAEIGDAP
jgi:hypothetical protein